MTIPLSVHYHVVISFQYGYIISITSPIDTVTNWFLMFKIHIYIIQVWLAPITNSAQSNYFFTSQDDTLKHQDNKLINQLLSSPNNTKEVYRIIPSPNKNQISIDKKQRSCLGIQKKQTLRDNIDMSKRITRRKYLFNLLLYVWYMLLPIVFLVSHIGEIHYINLRYSFWTYIYVHYIHHYIFPKISCTVPISEYIGPAKKNSKNKIQTQLFCGIIWDNAFLLMTSL